MTPKPDEEEEETPLQRIQARARELQAEAAAVLAKAESEGRLRRETREEPYYGPFPGGDPRKFTPDPECSTEDERANWRRACDECDANATVLGPQCAGIGDGSLYTGRGFGLGTGMMTVEFLIVTNEDGTEEEYA